MSGGGIMKIRRALPGFLLSGYGNPPRQDVALREHMVDDEYSTLRPDEITPRCFLDNSRLAVARSDRRSRSTCLRKDMGGQPKLSGPSAS